MRQEGRRCRIRLDPQPGVDDAHHEDDVDLQTRDAGLRKMAEREYGGYRNTRNPAWMGNSFSKSQFRQAEEVPAKYGLLHERTEGDSDPGILPFERHAFVQGLEKQCDRKTADRAETQGLRVLTGASPVPMKELEPHGIEAAAACPCQCQQSDGEHNAGELKRMKRKSEQARPPY